MDGQFTSTYMPYAPQAQAQQTNTNLATYANVTNGSQPHTPQQSLTPQASQNGQSSQQSQQQKNQPLGSASRDNPLSLASVNNASTTSSSSSNNGNTHPTLPPLQPTQNGFPHFGGLSFPHPSSATQTPTAPPTPSTQSTNGYSHVSPASAMAPPQSAYSSAYPMISQSVMFPTSSANGMSSAATSGPGLPNIRPMPPSSVANSIASLPSLANSQLSQQPPFMQQNEEAPTHVVGSQGRRGILPSAPGRPNATAASAATTSTKSMNLQKDADGKFPCPHCNKTYLHAKHLKRHMLRHTGDRPYSCHLCHDTFSRSDILKRHFQKCSIRRGNPTGLNHLANQRPQRNRLSNSQQQQQQDGPIGLAGLSEIAQSNAYSAGGILDHNTPGTGNASTRTSRANSLLTPVSMSHRNSIAGLGINGAPNDLSHPQSQYGTPNMQGYAMTNGGPMASAYAFSQPGINNQFYPAMHPQQSLPFLGPNSSRYDHSHSNSPHQQSPIVTDTNQGPFDSSRLLAHNGQDNLTNGNLSLGADAPKAEHNKHFNEFANDHQPALAQAWS